MKHSPLFTLLSGLGIAAVMILAAALVAWLGRTALGSFEAWQQALESVRPYLRWWRALLYGALFALWWDLLRRHRHRHRHRPQDRLRVQRIGTLGLVLFTCVELTRL
jgi:zinc transporter ZupT